jgi:hypothetical protein
MKHLLTILAVIGLSACGQQDASLSAISTAEPAQPELIVHKSASCGCCKVWVEHMRQHGFTAVVNDTENLSPIKEQVGVPYAMGSCHTAQVGGYFIEGHVPAEQVLRLLKEKPQAKGLTVPGMPVGSPGMEQGDVKEPYDVHLVHLDGTTSVYASYP